MGGGLGGLTAAALLAKSGLKVDVVERREAVGGCAHSFARGPYLFDPAIHISPNRQLFEDLLTFLDVRDRCTFASLDPIFMSRFPGKLLRHPAGRTAFVDALSEEFPAHAGEIRAFVGLCDSILTESHRLPSRLGISALADAETLFPVSSRYMLSSAQEVMSDMITEPRLHACLASFWPYVGVPASQMPFIAFAQVLGIFIDSACYCMGSYQRLADALAAAVEAGGGAVHLGTPVERIVIEGGRAAGVVLADGRQLSARTIVSNIDARQTFLGLVGREHLPEPFVRRLLRMADSLSAFVVYAAAAVELDPAAWAHQNFIHDGWDHDESYERIRAGGTGGTWLSIPTLTDASLAPPGEHILIFSSLATYERPESWAADKDEWRRQMVSKLDGLMPGFEETLTHLEAATPLTIERFMGPHRGAIYGWEQSQRVRPLNRETPVPGLHLTGQWTAPGPGSTRVVLSGVYTSRTVLKELGHEDAASSFQPESVPPG